jgi:hypothetical protein
MVFDLPEWTANDKAIAERLDQMRLDMQVLAIAPRFHRYGADKKAGVALGRDMNSDLAELISTAPTRLAGLIHLPLQDPSASVAEIERIGGNLEGLVHDIENLRTGGQTSTSDAKPSTLEEQNSNDRRKQIQTSWCSNLTCYRFHSCAFERRIRFGTSLDAGICRRQAAAVAGRVSEPTHLAPRS